MTGFERCLPLSVGPTENALRMAMKQRYAGAVAPIYNNKEEREGMQGAGVRLKFDYGFITRKNE
jgi:hypothetical protein